MKKILLPIILLLSSGGIYALPMGNPADPILLTSGIIWDWGSECCDPCLDSANECELISDDCSEECEPYEGSCIWLYDFWNCNIVNIRAGYYGDFVYNRHLRLQSFGKADIEHSEITTNAGLVVLNIVNKFDVYGTFGSSKISLDTNASTLGSVVGERLCIDSSSAFSWTVGAKLNFFECGCTTMGADGKYFHTTPAIRRITREGIVSIYPDDSLEIRYHEWQLGVGITHRINMFVPYFGLKWSRAKADFEEGVIALSGAGDTITLRNLKERDSWGLVYGVSLVDHEKISLTVEGRCRDEKALHVNAQIRF